MCRLHHRSQGQAIDLVPYGHFELLVVRHLADLESTEAVKTQNPISCPQIAWLNSNPRHFAFGAMRLIRGRNELEDDPPHLRALLNEEDMGSAYRTLNSYRRYCFTPLSTLVEDVCGKLPPLPSLLQGDTAVWQGHQKTQSEPVQKRCALFVDAIANERLGTKIER